MKKVPQCDNSFCGHEWLGKRSMDMDNSLHNNSNSLHVRGLCGDG